MINIKAYPVPKKTSSTTSSGGGQVSTSSTTTSLADNWFYFNNDYNAVCCRYDFYSVGSVAANGAPPEEGQERDDIVDNLTSTETNKSLSANMGRVLKSLIDSITTTSGGQAVITIDWSNVTNKPSTFAPSSHTHSMNDVNGLQSQLQYYSGAISACGQNIDAHIENNNIHLTSSQLNKLNTLTEQQFNTLADLLDMITVDTQSGTITVNGSIRTTNDVTAKI